MQNLSLKIHLRLCNNLLYIKARYGSCIWYFYIDNYGKFICPIRKSRSMGVKNMLNVFLRWLS